MYKQGSHRVLNSCESLEICPAIFRTWKESGKNGKKFWVILKATTSALHVNFFGGVGHIVFNLACTFASLWLEKVLFLRFFLWSLLKNYLITLSILEKEIIVLEKVCKKVANCWSKNLCEPCISSGLMSRSLRHVVVFNFLSLFQIQRWMKQPR